MPLVCLFWQQANQATPTCIGQEARQTRYAYSTKPIKMGIPWPHLIYVILSDLNPREIANYANYRANHNRDNGC